MRLPSDNGTVELKISETLPRFQFSIARKTAPEDSPAEQIRGRMVEMFETFWNHHQERNLENAAAAALESVGGVFSIEEAPHLNDRPSRLRYPLGN